MNEYITRVELQKTLRVSKATICRILQKNLHKDFVTKIGNKYIIDKNKFFEWYKDQDII